MKKAFMVPVGIAALGLTGVNSVAKNNDSKVIDSSASQTAELVTPLESIAEDAKSPIDYRLGNDLHQFYMVRNAAGTLYAAHGSHSSHGSHASHSSHRSGR